MNDQGQTGTEQSSPILIPVCPACGTPHDAGDRYCAECGAALPNAPVPNRPLAEPAGDAATRAVSEPAGPRDGGLWVLGAAPKVVISGGLLLLLLAAALLAIGQRDATGTIVMLSICVTPLALLVVIIGIVRALMGMAQRG